MAKSQKPIIAPGGRTTVRLPKAVHSIAKAAAAHKKIPIQEWIADAILQRVGRKAPKVEHRSHAERVLDDAVDSLSSLNAALGELRPMLRKRRK